MKQLLITIAAVVLVGCGEPATDTGKTDVQSTGKKQEADLATFLPGKRIYFSMPMPGDPGVPIEPAEPEPKLFSDEPEVETGKKPTPPEIVWQFQKNGTIAMGMFSDGEVEFFEGQNMSYKVNGLGVAGFEDGNEGGGMTFTSAHPKKGDKVLMGEKGQTKVAVTITKIEEASSPLPVSKTTAEPTIDGSTLNSKKRDSSSDNLEGEIPKISIHKAARSGNINIVKQHLNAGVDINLKDKNDETPLHKASWGEKEIVKLLIDEGADVNAKTSKMETPLHFVARYNRKEIAQLLISSGADVSAKNHYGETPLHKACEMAQGNIVKQLIVAGADVNAKTDSGKTALRMAAYDSKLKNVEILIEEGADVNAEDKSGETPLIHSAYYGQKKVVQFLISKGADINANARGMGSPLHSAARKGHKEVVELLIASNANVNAKDENGESPLGSAVRAGQKEIVELLFAKGADVSSDEGSLLHIAPTKETIELLIAKGLDVNAKDYGGNSSLHKAVFYNKIEKVEVLISKDAKINEFNGLYSTPLDIAIERNKTTEIADLLRKYGGKTGEELKAEGN